MFTMILTRPIFSIHIFIQFILQAQLVLQILTVLNQYPTVLSSIGITEAHEVCFRARIWQLQASPKVPNVETFELENIPFLANLRFCQSWQILSPDAL